MQLFNVQFMLLHVSAQMKDIFIVFVDFPVRLNVMKKLSGMENNIKQATAHLKCRENGGDAFGAIFRNVCFPGDDIAV